MGCFSHRRKQTSEIFDQKWDHIHLNDFRATGCGSHFAYAYLWFSLLLSTAVYAVDSFTAVNLLVFDRWSSEIRPAIPIDISKWIFSVCILLSFVNLGFEAVRAIRVMRRGNVAECYLDNLAVRWESIRMGEGQGYRRFLVFAELTKSKKGAEYIAIFTYFNLQAWIRVILCSGPRQFVNALTLKSVYQAKLADNQSGNVGSSILSFFHNIETLAEDNYRQAVILCSMSFTLVIFIFSALFMIAAVLFYVFFLFHWIPRSDGGLTGYCERKVNKALRKIVTKKVNTALAKDENDRIKAEIKAAKRAGEQPQLSRVRTGQLPTLPNVGPVSEDKLATMPGLGRTETVSTLPVYESRPSTPANIELSDLAKRPPMYRAGTLASTSSFSSRAPLLSSAADMPHGGAGTTEPTLPNIDLSNLPPRPGTSSSRRPGTSHSQQSFGHQPSLGHAATNSNSSLRMPFTETPAPLHDAASAFSVPPRPSTARPADGAIARDMQASASPAPGHYEAYNPDSWSAPTWPRPAFSGAPPGRQQTPLNQAPYQMNRSATTPMPSPGPRQHPERNLTTPAPAGALYPPGPRSQTSSPFTTYGPRKAPDRYIAASVSPQGTQMPASRADTRTPVSGRGYPPDTEEYTPGSIPPREPRAPLPRSNTMSPAAQRRPPNPRRNMTAPMPQRGAADAYENTPRWQGSSEASQNENSSRLENMSNRAYRQEDMEANRERAYGW